MAGFFGVLVLNTVLVRLPVAREYPWLFWAINGINAVVGIGVLLFGVPGFEGHPLVRFLVGLAILMHLAQNFAVKSRWDSEDRMERLDAEMRERMAYEEAEDDAESEPEVPKDS
jgi:hypothetical protein